MTAYMAIWQVGAWVWLQQIWNWHNILPISSGCPYTGVFTDTRKAYDLMDRGRCLVIPKAYGVGPKTLHLITDVGDPVEKNTSSSPGVGAQNFRGVVEVAGAPLLPPRPNPHLPSYFLLFTIDGLMVCILELSENNIRRDPLYGFTSIYTINDSGLSQSPMAIWFQSHDPTHGRT